MAHLHARESIRNWPQHARRFECQSEICRLPIASPPCVLLLILVGSVYFPHACRTAMRALRSSEALLSLLPLLVLNTDVSAAAFSNQTSSPVSATSDTVAGGSASPTDGITSESISDVVGPSSALSPITSTPSIGFSSVLVGNGTTSSVSVRPEAAATAMSSYISSEIASFFVPYEPPELGSSCYTSKISEFQDWWTATGQYPLSTWIDWESNPPVTSTNDPPYWNGWWGSNSVSTPCCQECTFRFNFATLAYWPTPAQPGVTSIVTNDLTL